jgi:hypothetical protein
VGVEEFLAGYRAALLRLEQELLSGAARAARQARQRVC